MKTQLTENEQRVYKYIVDYTRLNGFPPTIREITDGCYYTSTQTIHTKLQKLEEKGYIELPLQSSPRAIKVVGMRHVMEVGYDND